jgi:chemotaxis signal transduction protein
MSASHGSGSLGTRRSGSTTASGGGPPIERYQHNLCAFWLGEHCYGLQTALVGEVVTVDALTPVPLAPAPVRGLFNLRGAPVALVDLARVLELNDAAVAEDPRAGRPLVALVLRTESLFVGLLIRRMEMVITRGRGSLSPPEASATEHPVVAGFLELPDRPELPITVLDSAALLARLDRLKYLDSSDA